MEGGEWCVVTFMYETLPTFCFVCGILGHSEQNCEVFFAKTVDEGVREWGIDLRADTRQSGGGTGSRWLRNDNQRGGNPSSASGSARSDSATNPQENQSHVPILYDARNGGTTIMGSQSIAERIFDFQLMMG